jgi:phosphate transport system permease protein
MTTPPIEQRRASADLPGQNPEGLSTLPLAEPKPDDFHKVFRPTDELVRYVLLACGIISIFTTLGIVFVLGRESLQFFSTGTATVTEFLTELRWQPQSGNFGIWPLLLSTIITSLFAMLVSIPLGLGAAIYLSEYAAARTRASLKPILEILAGIPTVVYGYFALTFMTPLLRGLLGEQTVQIYNMASAGLVMGIMILPTIASMSEDALTAVPRSLREASYGLGATKVETIFRVILPAGLSGLLAAFILGVSRAVGETMIVALAAGAGPVFIPTPEFWEAFNPFQAGETITGHIARISGGDLSYNSVQYNSLFALGLALFIFTLILNLISRAITQRFREAYQ